MREIKFRAWHKNKMYNVKGFNNVTIYTDCWDGGSGYVNIPRQESELVKIVPSILMQYTGLKDRNGVETYEGDLLKIELDWGYGLAEIISKVYFKDGCFRAKAINSHEDTLLIELPYFDIIGNIYENLELLENNKKDKK